VKRVFIKTYGCQMNERDSEAVAALLRDRGYALAGNEREADVILLNTCSVRDLAEHKAIGKMGTLAQLKRQRPQLVLGYLGCMAQSRGATLTEKQPFVDLVVGTQKFHRVAEYLNELTGLESRPAGRSHIAPIVDVAEEIGSESTIKDHGPCA
jgi:tRNA-2-methylthio-N6-dimethylallyladenosine synthase